MLYSSIFGNDFNTARYDPKPYDFILQPVLHIGSWMDGHFAKWTLNSVCCVLAAGACVYVN